MMKDGKMMTMMNGKMMAMDKDMTMSNGTVCMMDGTCKMIDGKTMMMKEGETCDMDGKMGKMKMNKGMKHKMQVRYYCRYCFINCLSDKELGVYPKFQSV